MRISDWSSDVCSSDLFTTEQGLGVGAVKRGPTFARCIVVDDDPDILLSARLLLRDLFEEDAAFQSPDEALAAMHAGLPDGILLRSEARRVGKECCSTCRSRRSPSNIKNKTKHK